MNYKGKLYGRIGNNTYFDTAYTTDDWDAMEAKIKEIEKVKRKPLPDGTLPLTDEELEEIAKILDIHKIYGVRLIFEHLEYKDYDGCYPEIMNIKAILWLADRFDLTSNN